MILSRWEPTTKEQCLWLHEQGFRPDAGDIAAHVDYSDESGEHVLDAHGHSRRLERRAEDQQREV